MNIATLRNFSLGYLLAPNILFALGWFRWQYSVPVTFIFAYLFFTQLRNGQTNERYQMSRGNMLWLLLAACFWTFCTGVGGLSFQIADHQAHNAKFYDLFKNPWPTYFPEKRQYACYYFGYFIVPAAISKVLGHLSVTALLAWTVLGYWLALQWLYLLLRNRKLLIVLFLFLGGVGHLVKVAFYLFMTSEPFHVATFYSEIWSIFDQSIWVTSQIIPILLLSSILIYDAFITDRVEDMFLPITLCFLWAIFPSIIFVLLFGIIFLKKYAGEWQQLFTFKLLTPLVLAGIAFLPIFIFLRSSDGMPVNGFIWQFEPLAEIMAEYFVGVVLDLILIFLIIRELRGVDDLVPYWFAMATLALFVIMSTYRIGYWNDWFVRGYNPLLYMMLLLIVRSLYVLYQTKQWKRTVYFNFLITLMGLSLLIPAGHIVRSLRNNLVVSALFPDKFPFTPMPYDTYPNTYQTLLHITSGPGEANQYLGRKGSVYDIYLSRKP
ncbi:hypothetical protein [Dyadobacter arcticus]|uniref:EpsG family protein n=1 Tax=Dyadobacter arcticus TaxID=1078754 RepID=A0ABX0ULB2_9BACT|nr:hypothetical protein [Dyadobacter arcticus]NIJ53248.1 hypothetical protein [Dyadobacter arcticus]